MDTRLADRGRSRRLAAGIAQQALAAQLLHAALDIGCDERPRALVLWFFLAPDDLGVRETRQLIGQCEPRERIDLLEPQDLDTVLAALFALLEQVVIDLSRAK